MTPPPQFISVLLSSISLPNLTIGSLLRAIDHAKTEGLRVGLTDMQTKLLLRSALPQVQASVRVLAKHPATHMRVGRAMQTLDLYWFTSQETHLRPVRLRFSVVEPDVLDALLPKPSRVLAKAQQTRASTHVFEGTALLKRRLEQEKKEKKEEKEKKEKEADLAYQAESDKLRATIAYRQSVAHIELYMSVPTPSIRYRLELLAARKCKPEGLREEAFMSVLDRHKGFITEKDIRDVLDMFFGGRDSIGVIAKVVQRPVNTSMYLADTLKY